MARWCVRVAVASSQDAVYCLAVAAVLGSAYSLTRRFAPGKLRWFWCGAWMIVWCSALYGVVSVPIFRQLKVHLTYPLLSFVGNWREMSISARAAGTPAVWCILAGVPLAMVAAH